MESKTRIRTFLAVTVVALVFGLWTIFGNDNPLLTAVGVVAILAGVVGFLGAVGSSLGEEYDAA